MKPKKRIIIYFFILINGLALLFMFEYFRLSKFPSAKIAIVNSLGSGDRDISCNIDRFGDENIGLRIYHQCLSSKKPFHHIIKREDNPVYDEIISVKCCEIDHIYGATRIVQSRFSGKIWCDGFFSKKKSLVMAADMEDQLLFGASRYWLAQFFRRILEPSSAHIGSGGGP